MDKVAIYSRKSRFTGKGDSIANQVEMCRQYIQIHYPDIGEEDIIIYEDEGYSGGTTERPRFQQLMKDARQQLFNMVICYRLDRVSRNIGDFAKLIEELNNIGIAFISVKEQFDTTSPMGRAMMYIASVFSQLERETIAERIRDNLLELAKSGHWLGGTTPTGYTAIPVETIQANGKKHRAVALSLQPEESGLVQKIFMAYNRLQSLSQVETLLMNQNIKTRNGKYFSRFTIRNILQNPVYMKADQDAYHYFIEKNVHVYSKQEDFTGEYGVMAYNKTLQKTHKANQIRPMEEWIIAVGNHRGLVPGQEWVAAQVMLNKGHRNSFQVGNESSALLSGLLVCGDCGGYMRPKKNRRKLSDGTPCFRYLCETKEKSKMYLCQMKNPDGNLLDQAVFQEIEKIPGDRKAFISELQNPYPSSCPQKQTAEYQYQQYKKQIQENNEEIKKLISFLAGNPDPVMTQYTKEQVAWLHNQNTIIEEKVKEGMPQHGSDGATKDKWQEQAPLILSFSALFRSAPVSEKRQVLQFLLEKVVWDGQKIHIHLKSPPGAL